MEEARERLHSIKQEAEELTIFMEFLDKQQGGIIR
jgi:UDP-N-acetylglucosamine acyltransferase